MKARKTPATAKLEVELPFEATNWKTVWLDHFSFGATNYKASVSYYQNLLGWEGTYDEGSQNEVEMGDIGDAIIRGGNPADPNFGKAPANANAKARPRNIRIDHISFGIQPWDTDAIKAGLEKRGLRVQVDTGNTGDIHETAYKSYHTRTPKRGGGGGGHIQLAGELRHEGNSAYRVELDEAEVGAVGGALAEIPLPLAVLALGLLAGFLTHSQPAMPQRAEWAYGGDSSGTRYSPLKQINRANVGKLRWKCGASMQRAVALQACPAASKHNR